MGAMPYKAGEYMFGLIEPIERSYTLKPVLKPTNQKAMTKNPSISFPESFHAFLLENVTVRDSGTGTSVVLEFADGTLRRADVNPELLRMGNLNGHWRATLYFRTNAGNKVRNFVTLQRLRVIDPEFHEGSFWTASGKVIKLDREANQVVIRIFPTRSKSEPFAISARATLEQINDIKDALFVHMSGRLEGDELVASEVQAVDLTLPERWKDWVQPTRPKQNAKKEVGLSGSGEST
jgi:hypothetical protein